MRELNKGLKLNIEMRLMSLYRSIPLADYVAGRMARSVLAIGASIKMIIIFRAERTHFSIPEGRPQTKIMFKKLVMHIVRH